MTRFATHIAALALGALVVWAGSHLVAAPQHSDTRPARASYELDDGIHDVTRPGVSHSVAFVWTHTDSSGALIETWALFREGTPQGWLYPGANNPSVTVNFAFRANVQHASLDAFLTWCAAQYPASMNVDKSTDFAVHEHVVTVL